jgi:prepilin-type N-terminal cleavage/methylation domain-containing protein
MRHTRTPSTWHGLSARDEVRENILPAVFIHGTRYTRAERPCHVRAFTLLELVVVLAILGILLSIFVPYALAVRESGNRARCADNLRQIQAALQLYGETNGNNYPCVRQAKDSAAWTAFTGASSTDNAFAPNSAVAENDVTASLWLLVRLKLAKPEIFVCPSSDASPQTESNVANFKSPVHLSYSYATPFSVLPDYRLNSDRLRPEFAVVADMNPGVGGDSDVVGPAKDAPQIARSRGNSRNHGRAGQNVLFGNGLVQFKTSQYCGFGDDNIYSALRPIPIPGGEQPAPDQNGIFDPKVGPAWYSDSFLVPTATDGPR